MNKKNSYKYEELIDCANGKLFGPGNAKLPSPPMLMFDRITNIQNEKVQAVEGGYSYRSPVFSANINAPPSFSPV